MTTSEPDRSLHEVAEAVLAGLVGRYRVGADEDPERALSLEPPPPPGFVRVVRLVPDGTEGESLTVVLTAAGGVSVHVRRSLVLELAAGAPDPEPRLLAVAEGLGWSRRG